MLNIASWIGRTRHLNALSRRNMVTKNPKSSQPKPRALLPDLEYSEDIFKYTRGRFVCDEGYELSQRQVRFNVNELARCAAQAIGARTCISIEKYPDGMYNKSILLTMDNGVQVVAKVPNPNAGIPHFTTASEVATMDFVRNVFKTPIPQVLAWNSKAHEHPVGAEYIIMEKVPGVELERVWPSMDIKARYALVKNIAEFQKAWSSVSFMKFGGLYFANDLDASLGEPLYVDASGTPVLDKKFAIGPTTGRESIDNRRATIHFDRGPWNSLEEYHSAIGYREIACVNQLQQLPKSPITLCGPGTYQPTRARKLKALRCYLDLIKFLLPKDQVVSSAHLWHGDLHVANIFVDPLEPTKILGLIDWQSTEICPLYFHARQPHFLDYDGPPVTGLERPQLPTPIGALDAVAKKQAETLYLQQSLCSLYNTWTHHHNPKLYAALRFQQTTSYLLLLLARNLLIDGEASYLSHVAELEAAWDTLPGTKGRAYPFSFSTAEQEQIEAEVEGVIRGMEAMRSIRESMNELFPEQGIVRSEQYEETMDALADLKEQVIQEFASNQEEREIWEKMWPFGT